LTSGCGPFLAVVWLVYREIDSVVISASVYPPGVGVVEAIVDLLLVDDMSEACLWVFWEIPTGPLNDPVGVSILISEICFGVDLFGVLP